MSKPAIGFIGLGLMGSAMCENLMERGFDLGLIANRSRDAIDALVAAGATEYSSAQELAATSDFVFLCVDTSASVEERILGDAGVILGAKPGSVVIDFGTSLPASTKAIGAKLAERGVGYLDAPIGRTPNHAREGKINLMCSGEQAVFDQVQPVLAQMAENVFHLGALGTGHTIKLINNFFAQNTANAMAEAFAMADVMGVERQALYDVMAAGPLRSPMMEFVRAFAVDGDAQQLAFSVKNATKDVAYYGQMAKDAGIDSIMVKSTLAALEGAVEQGRGETLVPEQVDFFAGKYKG